MPHFKKRRAPSAMTGTKLAGAISDDPMDPFAEAENLLTQLKEARVLSSDQKRALHGRISLLGMDVDDWHGAATDISDQDFARLEKLRQRLTECLPVLSLLPPPEVRHNTLEHAVRFLGLVIAFFVVLPMLILLAFLTPVVPLLKKLKFSHYWQPPDIGMRLVVHSWLTMLGVRVHVRGRDNVPLDQPVMTMFNHTSNLDPIIVSTLPQETKWVAKKAILFVPFLGQLAWAFGHLSINRGKRSEAIKIINQAAQRWREQKVSVAISPEGTRTATGQLAPFKKGPFHMALSTQYPIVPVLIRGAYELWPGHCGQLFSRPGDVVVDILPPIQPKPTDDAKSLSNRVRRALLEASTEPTIATSRGTTRMAADKRSLFVMSSMYVVLGAFMMGFT